jgi:hypothetical protein
MHFLTARGAPISVPLLYDAFNRLLIGYGWLGNPLFLAGLTGVSALEVRSHTIGMPRGLAWVGSATGLYVLEPLIFGNVPAFLWLGYYGFRVARMARTGATT